MLVVSVMVPTSLFNISLMAVMANLFQVFAMLLDHAPNLS